jgi:uncharacterized protein YacL
MQFIRLVFISLCGLAGYAISVVQPDLLPSEVHGGLYGLSIGFLWVGIDLYFQGLSLRSFSAATFGMFFGMLPALILDASGLFVYAPERIQWVIRLITFVGFSYLGMMLSLRSNKEDFYLLIPFVRFSPKGIKHENFILDTCAIIDGRFLDLIRLNFLDGVVIVPKFVLAELHAISDSSDPNRSESGKRGLMFLEEAKSDPKISIRIHEADFPEENDVDAKLVRLANMLQAKLLTNDRTLGKIAELNGIIHLNPQDLTRSLRHQICPGDVLPLRIQKAGKEKDQGIGYLDDGTMVVVNHARELLGQLIRVEVSSLLPTTAGVMVFAELERKSS